MRLLRPPSSNRRFGEPATPEHRERGSMPMAMLIIIVGVSIGALLVPMLISQRKATTFSSSRVLGLNAAQAGIDAMIGKIRNAANGTQGDPSQLPCTTDSTNNNAVTPLTGTVVSGNGSPARYSVVVTYYVSDPIAHPEAAPMDRCVPGAGPFDTTAKTPVPLYAQITSTGVDGMATDPDSTGRKLTTYYALQVDNANISGGQLRIYPDPSDGDNQWCIDVGDSTPTAGITVPTMQPCSGTLPPAAQQVFAYRSDLTLQLPNSVGTTVNGTTYKYGLCLDIKTFNTGKTAPASNSNLVLNQCGPLGTPVWSQQWSIDQYRSLQAPTSTSSTTGVLAGLCMTVSDHADGASISLKTCDQKLTSPDDAWIPSPSVGAGAATKANSRQWINFSQFGRCLNLPNADTAALYLTAPGCRQNPNLASIQDNQKIYWDSSSKWFYFIINNAQWCIYSKHVVGGLLRVTPCTNNPTGGITVDMLKWDRSQPSITPNAPYSQQYRFTDSTGLCLSLADIQNVPGDSYGTTYNVWYKGVSATCDGTTIQQWNASNNVGNSALQNTRENPVSGN